MAVLNQLCIPEGAPHFNGACDSEFGIIRKIFLVKNSFSFADLAGLQTEATWTAAIQSENIIPLPPIRNAEANNKDAIFEDLSYSNGQTFVQDGRAGWLFWFPAYLTRLSEFNKINPSTYRFIFVDDRGNAAVSVMNDGTIKGMEFELAAPLGQVPNDGASSAKYRLQVLESDSLPFSKNLDTAYLGLDFFDDPLFEGLIGLSITSATVATNVVTAVVKDDSFTVFGGLTATTDWEIDGVNPTLVSYSAGVYTVTFASASAGDVLEIAAAGTLGTGASGYKGINTFTLVAP